MKFYVFTSLILLSLLLCLSQSKPTGGRDEISNSTSSSTLKDETLVNTNKNFSKAEGDLQKHGKKIRKKKRKDVYKETSPEEILKMLTSKDLSQRERKKLACLAKAMSQEMGPHPKTSFQRFKFQGHKMKVRLARSEEQANLFEKKVDAIIGRIVKWFLKVPIVKKIATFLGYKDPSEEKQKEEKKIADWKSMWNGEPPILVPTKTVSVPINTPGISEIIFGDKLQTAKKIFIYVHAENPARNKQIENLVEKAHTESETKFPLIKINRHPGDTAIRELYGAGDAVLTVFELKRYAEVNAASLADDEKNWTLQVLTKFFQNFSTGSVERVLNADLHNI